MAEACPDPSGFGHCESGTTINLLYLLNPFNLICIINLIDLINPFNLLPADKLGTLNLELFSSRLSLRYNEKFSYFTRGRV